MMKKFLQVVLLCLSAVVAQAQAIDEGHVKRMAENFFFQRGVRSVSELREVPLSAAEACRVYALGDNFVVVSAHEALPAILGYGRLDTRAMPQSVASFLHAFTVAANRHSTTDVHLPQGLAIEPLLTMVRHQKHPYNAACPRVLQADSTWSNTRAVVGCVATALEEIITYHRRVLTLQDTLKGWTTPHYVIADAMPGTTVDTRLILDDYDTQQASEASQDAVARLSLYCGMAARMNWGLEESGANVRNLVEPLKYAFGWGYVHYADSYRYAPADWVAMIVQELKAGRPVLYAGYTQLIQGHAFVVDGLQEDGLFHVNWGYGGHYDGYFRLDVLAAYEAVDDRYDDDSAQGFFCNQELLMLYPDSIDVALPDTLERVPHDVVVDSMRVLSTPHVGIYTPIRVYVRHAGQTALTTPFELLSNAPTDTARFEQADYVGLSGVTLNPGESACLDIAALFTESGSRVLSISPDDINILCEIPIEVQPAVASRLSFHVSEPQLMSPDAVRIVVEAYNALTAEGRCGELYRAFLDEGDSCRNYEGATQKASFLYLNPGESRVDTFEYVGLKPGETYTFRMAYSWHTIRELQFTMPQPSDVSPVVHSGKEEAMYNLKGQKIKVSAPGEGVYIQNKKKKYRQ
ncbi:MAG: C10 family peptidase [Bacteroidaceae bacterium]|nr:C10 family peptidase [Bacteroidaceae bacterium]